jgi:membrane protease YdiL (CAAX protease family)
MLEGVNVTDFSPWIFGPHVVLLIAAVAVHLAPRAWVLAILALALGGGLVTGGVTWLGVGVMGLLAGLLWAATAAPNRLTRVAGGLSGFALAAALSDGLLPGFARAVVFDHHRFTPDAAPFSMSLNFDKTGAGVLIMLWVVGARRLHRLDRAQYAVVLKVLAALVAVIMPAAVLSGFVAFEPKWPAGGWVWAVNNLFFVCLAEEALYRGFLLDALLRALPKRRIAVAGALALSSVAFGLAHYRHGPVNVALAALAGVFYGYAFVRTGRVRTSMLVHFGLNLIHFIFFSYPARGH